MIVILHTRKCLSWSGFGHSRRLCYRRYSFGHSRCIVLALPRIGCRDLSVYSPPNVAGRVNRGLPLDSHEACHTPVRAYRCVIRTALCGQFTVQLARLFACCIFFFRTDWGEERARLLLSSPRRRAKRAGHVPSQRVGLGLRDSDPLAPRVCECAGTSHLYSRCRAGGRALSKLPPKRGFAQPGL